MAEFIFKYNSYAATKDGDEDLPYPVTSEVSATYDFGDGVTWDVVLFQMCKFLEASGYAGVLERVRLVDNFGNMRDNNLFVCVSDYDEEKDWDDAEEDEEEADEEEEVDSEKDRN